MAVRTSMLHIRVDDDLKAEATEKLANMGLTVSDAVRILLTRIAREGALPPGLTADPEVYDAWFRQKVQEALADPRPTSPHRPVMDEVQVAIDRKRRARCVARSGSDRTAGGRRITHRRKSRSTTAFAGSNRSKTTKELLTTQ